MTGRTDPIAERWADALAGIETAPADATGEDLPPEVYEAFPEARMEPAPSKAAATTTDMKTAIVDAITALHDRASRGRDLAGESIGYPQLDRLLDGVQRGNVYVVGARSGIGKSIFAVNASLALARAGYAVHYFTHEMPTREQVMRALFCWSGVGSYRIKLNKMRDEDWSDLTTAAQALCKFPLTWDEGCGLTIEEIERRVTEKIKATEQDQEPLFAVVIDHVLLLRGSNERQPRREQLVHITQRIKAMAKERNVAVIALAQLNRALEARSVKDKEPQISDLKETGSFEEDADAVILLYRKDHYAKRGEERDNVMKVIVPKVRGGEPGVVHLRFTGDCYRVDNLEEECAPDDATRQFNAPSTSAAYTGSRDD